MAVLATGCGGDDKAELTAEQERGKEVFLSAGCAGCHTLADAGATGLIGGDLDY